MSLVNSGTAALLLAWGQVELLLCQRLGKTMNTVGNSAGPCAVCLGALGDESNKKFPYSLLPTFIRRLMGNDSVLMLKPCNHKFTSHA